MWQIIFHEKRKEKRKRMLISRRTNLISEIQSYKFMNDSVSKISPISMD